jgi:cellobiose-specific phosphotransferase system component IIC
MRQKSSNLLWFAPIPIVAGAFFVAVPRLKALDDAFLMPITIASSLFVMAWAIFLSTRVEHGLDEVQQASQRFGMRYGMTAGSMAFAVLLMLPPFKDFATAFVIQFGKPGPGMTVDRSVVVFAMALGFMGVSLLQIIGTIVMTTIWWKTRQ